jgi:hypothetical protein
LRTIRYLASNPEKRLALSRSVWHQICGVWHQICGTRSAALKKRLAPDLRRYLASNPEKRLALSRSVWHQICAVSGVQPGEAFGALKKRLAPDLRVWHQICALKKRLAPDLRHQICVSGTRSACLAPDLRLDVLIVLCEPPRDNWGIRGGLAPFE